MSNFVTFTNVPQGLPGLAPQLFVATTPDSVEEITAEGYMNDLSPLARTLTGSPNATERGIVKINDIVYINYDLVQESDVLPIITSATLGIFRVAFDGTDYTLEAFEGAVDLGQAAFKDVTSNAEAKVVSAHGTFTAGGIVASNDTAGTSVQSAAYFRAQTANYAGGSATATITDANITATSVVTLNISASTTAVTVQKVTPGTGSITVLMSADPGASTKFNYIAIGVAQ